MISRAQRWGLAEPAVPAERKRQVGRGARVALVAAGYQERAKLASAELAALEAPADLAGLPAQGLLDRGAVDRQALVPAGKTAAMPAALEAPEGLPDLRARLVHPVLAAAPLPRGRRCAQIRINDPSPNAKGIRASDPRSTVADR